jgi:hypothetical protein
MKTFSRPLFSYSYHFSSSGFVCYPTANTVPRSRIRFTLQMEATRPSETSVLTRLARHHIPEEGIIQNIDRLQLYTCWNNYCSLLLLLSRVHPNSMHVTLIGHNFRFPHRGHYYDCWLVTNSSQNVYMLVTYLTTKFLTICFSRSWE